MLINFAPGMNIDPRTITGVFGYRKGDPVETCPDRVIIRVGDSAYMIKCDGDPESAADALADKVREAAKQQDGD